LPGQTVTFSGSGADFEGTIVGYSWYSTLDGPLSDQATFSTLTLSEGVHSIFFKVQDNSGAWSSEIQTAVDVNDYTVETTEHIFFAPGYATVDATPVMISALEDMGATQNGDVWEYRNTARNKNYIIHSVNTNQELIDALEWQDSVVLYFGHSNYGLGQLFATQQEFDTEVIEDILYVDDDRILNSSSPVAHVNVSGMRNGQAYPHWWPIYKDGSDAKVPYEVPDDWEDPEQEHPAYNYYVTYRVPGDPTYHKIETVRNSAIDRFSDWDGPAWYDENGGVPDPANYPDHLQYYITNPEPWSPSFELIGNWVETQALDGFFRENYRYSAPGSGADQAKWMFEIPVAGNYNVYAWWPASAASASNAPYTINHAAGSTTVPMNQRLNGGQWNIIGVFYFDVGEYTAVLTDDANGNVVADGLRIEHVDNPPEILKADFHGRYRSGPAPLSVYFDSENVGDIDTFLWDFGNGIQNETRSTIWQIYTEPGTYTVTYTINGPLGTDTTTEVDYITVGDSEPPLKAEFGSSTSQQGMVPFEASFRDRSSGDIVSWEWDLDGDGVIDSTDQNPTITYTEPGIYTVSLTVKDINAVTDTETKENFVRIIIFDKNIDNVDYPKTHYSSKTLLKRKVLEVSPQNFKYARFFFGGCDSAHYYTETFQRGIYHYASGSTLEGEYAMANYVEAYVNGKSDYEIWQVLQTSEPKYDYYDFNKPPSEQW
jgi:PKD repeat protein